MTDLPPGAGSARAATARPVEPADRDAVRSLREEAMGELALLRGGPLYVEREAAPLPEPDEPGTTLWVGVFAGAVAGYLSARVDGNLGRIEAIYVAPRFRAVGVGEAMISEAVAWFRSQGCAGVDATALPGSRATKNFFEETGFTARLLVMHRPL